MFSTPEIFATLALHSGGGCDAPNSATTPTTTATPSDGTYSSSQNVELSADVAEATIYYSLDQTPTINSSNLYTAPIEINTATTIKYFAVSANCEDEEIKTSTYYVSIHHTDTSEGNNSGNSATPTVPVTVPVTNSENHEGDGDSNSTTSPTNNTTLPQVIPTSGVFDATPEESKNDQVTNDDNTTDEDNTAPQPEVTHTEVSKDPAIIDNSGGEISNTTNKGTINGGTVSGTITNEGVLNNVVIGENSQIIGGRISGTLRSSGQTATITGAILDVTEMDNVAIGFGCRLTPNTVSNNPGLELTKAITDDNGLVDINATLLIDEHGDEKTVQNILTQSLTSFMNDDKLIVNQSKQGEVFIDSDFLGNAIVPLKPIAIHTSVKPDGVTITPTGEVVIISNGLETTMSPSAYDLAAFNDGLAEYGIEAEIHPEGIVIAQIPGGERLSVRFDLFATTPDIVNPTPNTGHTRIAFSTEGEISDLGNFSYIVIYPNGVIQKIPPSVHDSQALSSILTGLDIEFRIDLSSGTIELLDDNESPFLHLIAGYTLDESQNSEAVTSIAVAGDLNDDQLTDYYLLTVNGRQIIYTLPSKK